MNQDFISDSQISNSPEAADEDTVASRGKKRGRRRANQDDVSKSSNIESKIKSKLPVKSESEPKTRRSKSSARGSPEPEVESLPTKPTKDNATKKKAKKECIQEEPVQNKSKLLYRRKSSFLMELWSSNLIECLFGDFANVIVGTPIWNLYKPEPQAQVALPESCSLPAPESKVVEAECEKEDTTEEAQAAIDKGPENGEATVPEDGPKNASFSGKPRVTALCQQLARSDLDAHLLIEPHQYGVEGDAGEGMKQPFTIVVHPQVWLVTDVHSHLCDAEVIGLLAGVWDASLGCMYIQNAFPCSSTDRVDDDGSTDVELDPTAELLVRETISRIGLQVVGWYHSHPRFRPDPSITDIFNQSQYQRLMRSDKGDEPFVGLIVSSYDSSLPTYSSLHQWFHVMPLKYETSRLKKEVFVPLQLETQIVSLAKHTNMLAQEGNHKVSTDDYSQLQKVLMSIVADTAASEHAIPSSPRSSSSSSSSSNTSSMSISEIQKVTRSSLPHSNCSPELCLDQELDGTICLPIKKKAKSSPSESNFLEKKFTIERRETRRSAKLVPTASNKEQQQQQQQLHYQRQQDVSVDSATVSEENFETLESTGLAIGVVDSSADGAADGFVDDETASIELDTFTVTMSGVTAVAADDADISAMVPMHFAGKGGPNYLSIPGDSPTELDPQYDMELQHEYEPQVEQLAELDLDLELESFATDADVDVNVVADADDSANAEFRIVVEDGTVTGTAILDTTDGNGDDGSSSAIAAAAAAAATTTTGTTIAIATTVEVCEADVAISEQIDPMDTIKVDDVSKSLDTAVSEQSAANPSDSTIAPHWKPDDLDEISIPVSDSIINDEAKVGNSFRRVNPRKPVVIKSLQEMTLEQAKKAFPTPSASEDNSSLQSTNSSKAGKPKPKSDAIAPLSVGRASTRVPVKRKLYSDDDFIKVKPARDSTGSVESVLTTPVNVAVAAVITSNEASSSSNSNGKSNNSKTRAVVKTGEEEPQENSAVASKFADKKKLLKRQSLELIPTQPQMKGNKAVAAGSSSTTSKAKRETDVVLNTANKNEQQPTSKKAAAGSTASTSSTATITSGSRSSSRTNSTTTTKAAVAVKAVPVEAPVAGRKRGRSAAAVEVQSVLELVVKPKAANASAPTKIKSKANAAAATNPTKGSSASKSSSSSTKAAANTSTARTGTSSSTTVAAAAAAAKAPAKTKASNKKIPPELVYTETCSLLQLLQSDGSACSAARDIVCNSRADLQFPMLLLALIVFYYSSHARRVDFEKKFKDVTRRRKAAESAKESLSFFGLTEEESQVWVDRFCELLEFCWKESPKDTRKRLNKSSALDLAAIERAEEAAGAVRYKRI